MITRLRVLHGQDLVGELAEGAGGVIAFQYDRDWLAKGFDLAPASVPFDGMVNPAARALFGGLPGVFNDSLPDGWGLLLMDRALKKHKNLDRADISPLIRLAYMGNRCMGALAYQPELLPDHDGKAIDLAEIAAQSEKVLRGEASDVLEELRICGGSPGGARPKVTVAFSGDMQVCQSSYLDLPAGYSHWIVKFRNDSRQGESDPVELGRLEMAYADMARAAGLEMPETRLLELTVNRTKEAFFAVKRFDREGNRRIHFLSLAGYVYANHREPSLDYSSGVLPATRKLTQSDAEVEKAFRRMLFNVFSHNKDDHSKNFAYLFDPLKGRWRLSPAYDLTFSTGMSNQHTTAISGAGNPTFADLKKVATDRRIKEWRRIMDEVRGAVAQWPVFASDYEVSQAGIEDVARALSAIDKVCSG
ncbi:MAG: type II toxin-antitoxin system HipA family toxin [Rhodocyclaceae bacterium]|nr:type II toxin-antitoxin system HipA family toxin [Rhodocyclaceae bacterium]